MIKYYKVWWHWYWRIRFNEIDIIFIDINEIVVSNMFPFGKQDFKYLFCTNILKKLDLFEYSVQKWVYVI